MLCTYVQTRKQSLDSRQLKVGVNLSVKNFCEQGSVHYFVKNQFVSELYSLAGSSEEG